MFLAVYILLPDVCKNIDKNVVLTTILIFPKVENEKFYPDSQDSEEDDDDNDEGHDENKTNKNKPYIMDPDHRLLLRVTKPLLQSRNAAVSRLNL